MSPSPARLVSAALLALALGAAPTQAQTATPTATPALAQISDTALQAVVVQMTTYPDQLKPKLWDNMKLKPAVRERAVMMAQLLFQDIHIPGLKIRDILLLGSNASYEYDAWSDLDVHILVDTTGYQGDRKTLAAYLDTLNDLNETRFNIRFYGAHVDFAFYPKDIESRLEQGVGVYSLTTGKWLKLPQVNPAYFSREQIFTDSRHYIDAYNALATSFAAQKIGFDCQRFTVLREDLRDYRRKGMIGTGIRSTANITYRLLRRLDFNLLREAEAMAEECSNINASLH